MTVFTISHLLKHTARLLTAALLLTACATFDSGMPPEDCLLTISIDLPQRPLATRANEGLIGAAASEYRVNTLQLWVFRHTNGALLGYLEVADPGLETANRQYQMAIDPAFADMNDRNVDVYAVANINPATCGLTLGRSTSRTMLDEATFGGSFFGVAPLTTTPPDDGLPMSGVLKDAEVVGTFPALHIGTSSEVASVVLGRAVSRLRFVLCQLEDTSGKHISLKHIDSVTLHGDLIPQKEYLMLGQAFSDTQNAPTMYRISTTDGYEPDAISFSDIPAADDIPAIENPLDYVFNQSTMTGQDYEDLVNKAIETGRLTTFGRTYLRESDRKLTGTIAYTVEKNGAEEQKSVDFEMGRNGDFTRDHSWIVYAYFMGDALHVFSVAQVGIKTWTSDTPESHNVYNW